jgi:hypothetical protein
MQGLAECLQRYGLCAPPRDLVQRLMAWLQKHQYDLRQSTYMKPSEPGDFVITPEDWRWKYRDVAVSLLFHKNTAASKCFCIEIDRFGDLHVCPVSKEHTGIIGEYSGRRKAGNLVLPTVSEHLIRALDTI